jgi:hypothetical protein
VLKGTGSDPQADIGTVRRRPAWPRSVADCRVTVAPDPMPLWSAACALGIIDCSVQNWSFCNFCVRAALGLLTCGDPVEEAEAEHRAVVVGRIRAPGAEHPDTLKSQDSLAKIQRELGRPEGVAPSIGWREIRLSARLVINTRRARYRWIDIGGSSFRSLAVATARLGRPMTTGLLSCGLGGFADGGEGLCGPSGDGLPVPQIPGWTFAVPGRVNAAEDRDRDRVQPAALGQRPVELGAGALPGILGVAAWPHPEHSHRYAGKLPAVASEEPVGIAVPASGVQRSPEHDQVESGGRFPHRLG